MSDQSFAGLCGRMQGKSITRGWDAIVTMDRTKVNSLLEQQYISKLKMDSFSEKIYGEIKISPDGYSMLDFTGLVLGQPRLSFEEASLENSRARLTMDVESGTVSQRLNVPGYPSRVTESFMVTPQQGFKVFMDVELIASTGIVEDNGRVIFDLGNAFNFSSNLLEDGPAQAALGYFFQRLYSRLPEEARVYELGTLNFNDDDMLVPREFEIRTQKAPADNDLLSDGGLGGAVVLFIRTRNNPTNGSTPVEEGDFPYLIPDDRDPDTGEAIYSGSLVLASRVVFDWVIEPNFMHQIGLGLRFQRETQSNDVARSLSAVAGGLLLEDYSYKWEVGHTTSYVSNRAPMFIKMSDDDRSSSLSVFIDANMLLCIRWRGVRKLPFYYEKGHLWPVRPTKIYYDAIVTPDVFGQLKVVVGDGDKLYFQMLQGGVADIAADWAPDGYWVPDLAVEELNKRAKPILDAVVKTFEDILIPEINVFHLNHLLFPEQNALLLTEAALPGDLFLAGHIDPKQTAFTLEPLFSRVKAGRTLQLEVKHLALRDRSITWSARHIDGEQVPETISQTGLFTAPDFAQIKDLAERYIVTASYTADDGTLREASAMIAVVVESLTVTPSIATLEFSEAKPITLRAISLDTGPLTWTLRENFGELLPDGNNAIYKLPEAAPEQPAGLVVIDVEDRATGEKTSATILWLQKNFIMPVQPGYHPGLPAKASTQLRVADRDVDPDDVSWEVLAGEGRVSDSGLYTAPDVLQSPYEVVQATYGRGPLARRGYGIVHLSNFARESKWTELRYIKLSSDSPSDMVYANGLQQVRVNVLVRPRDVGGKDVDVSNEEINSIQLLSMDENGSWHPLNRVGKSGVPEGGTWGYSVEKNDYAPYPAGPDTASALGERSALFFVQSRAIGTLQIAASLRGDDGLIYRSNAVGDPADPERTFTARAVPPPDFASTVFTFTITRVEGLDSGDDDEDGENDGNDDDLTTVDYYVLELALNEDRILIENVAFDSAKSMVQWESRQFDEDVCSFTGYAFAGSPVLNFDPLLYERMPEPIRPEKVVLGELCPAGCFLISLHRCEYWPFDWGCETDYTTGLKLIIHDVNGNRHRVRINFKTPGNRNDLTVTPY